MSEASNEIVIDFDDPTRKQVTRRVREAGEVGAALRQLQGDYPDLNFLVDITAPSRERLSLVLAGEEGMGILWGDPPLRTLGGESRVDEIPVWDGAGVEMPGCEFLPLSALIPAIGDWLKRGHAAPLSGGCRS